MAVWTLVMGLNALAPTFIFLFITRLGVGVVEANGPASISLLSDYYPVEDRAKKIGLYNSGALVGSARWASGSPACSWTTGAGAPRSGCGSRSASRPCIILLRAPEPARGDQDADFAALLGSVEVVELAGKLELPPPTRIGSTDYEDLAWRDAYREIFRIRSMWFGVIGITVSQALLAGLGLLGRAVLQGGASPQREQGGSVRHHLRTRCRCGRRERRIRVRPLVASRDRERAHLRRVRVLIDRNSRVHPGIRQRRTSR